MSDLYLYNHNLKYFNNPAHYRLCIRSSHNNIIKGVIEGDSPNRILTNQLMLNAPYLLENKINKEQLQANDRVIVFSYEMPEESSFNSSRHILCLNSLDNEKAIHEQISLIKEQGVTEFISDLYPDEIEFESQEQEEFFLKNASFISDSDIIYAAATKNKIRSEKILLIEISGEKHKTLDLLIIDSLKALNNIETVTIPTEELLDESINAILGKQYEKVITITRNCLIKSFLSEICLRAGTQFQCLHNGNESIARKLTFEQRGLKQILGNKSQKSIRQQVQALIRINSQNKSLSYREASNSTSPHLYKYPVIREIEDCGMPVPKFLKPFFYTYSKASKITPVLHALCQKEKQLGTVILDILNNIFQKDDCYERYYDVGRIIEDYKSINPSLINIIKESPENITNYRRSILQYILHAVDYHAHCGESTSHNLYDELISLAESTISLYSNSRIPDTLIGFIAALAVCNNDFKRFNDIYQTTPNNSKGLAARAAYYYIEYNYANLIDNKNVHTGNVIQILDQEIKDGRSTVLTRYQRSRLDIIQHNYTNFDETLNILGIRMQDRTLLAIDVLLKGNKDLANNALDQLLDMRQPRDSFYQIQILALSCFLNRKDAIQSIAASLPDTYNLEQIGHWPELRLCYSSAIATAAKLTEALAKITDWRIKSDSKQASKISLMEQSIDNHSDILENIPFIQSMNRYFSK